jgi:hypothetical protein
MSVSRPVCQHNEGGWWEDGLFVCKKCRVRFKKPPHEGSAEPLAKPPDPSWNPYDPTYVPPCFETLQQIRDQADLLFTVKRARERG